MYNFTLWHQSGIGYIPGTELPAWVVTSGRTSDLLLPTGHSDTSGLTEAGDLYSQWTWIARAWKHTHTNPVSYCKEDHSITDILWINLFLYLCGIHLHTCGFYNSITSHKLVHSLGSFHHSTVKYNTWILYLYLHLLNTLFHHMFFWYWVFLLKHLNWNFQIAKQNKI